MRRWVTGGSTAQQKGNRLLLKKSKQKSLSHHCTTRTCVITEALYRIQNYRQRFSFPCSFSPKITSENNPISPTVTSNNLTNSTHHRSPNLHIIHEEKTLCVQHRPISRVVEPHFVDRSTWSSCVLDNVLWSVARHGIGWRIILDYFVFIGTVLGKKKKRGKVDGEYIRWQVTHRGSWDICTPILYWIGWNGEDIKDGNMDENLGIEIWFED